MIFRQIFDFFAKMMSASTPNRTLNNSKGLDKILRGSNSSVTPKKKVSFGGRVEKKFGNSQFDYPTDCFYCVQQNAWCDQRVMDFWASKIFNPYIHNSKGGESYQNSLLLMDNFSVHCTLETCREIAKSGTRILLLPPNTTSKPQLLEVGIIKPFKDSIRGLFIAHLATFLEAVLEMELETIDFSKITRVTISKWISKAWMNCSSSIDVKKSLIHIGYFEKGFELIFYSTKIVKFY
jgi:hypothetical protein